MNRNQYVPNSYSYGTYPFAQQNPALLRNEFVANGQPFIETDPESTPGTSYDMGSPETICENSPSSSDGEHVVADGDAIFGARDEWFSRDDSAFPIRSNITASFNTNEGYAAFQPPPPPTPVYISQVSQPPFQLRGRPQSLNITDSHHHSRNPYLPLTPQSTITSPFPQSSSSSSSTPKAPSVQVPEMHLQPPPTPISPYYRPATFQSPTSPSTPGFAPVNLDTQFLRRSRMTSPIEACIEPHNLILPKAQFKSSRDPRGAGLQWTEEHHLPTPSYEDFNFSLFQVPTVAEVLETIAPPKQWAEESVIPKLEVEESLTPRRLGVYSQVPAATSSPLPTRKRSRSVSADPSYVESEGVSDEDDTYVPRTASAKSSSATPQPPAAKRARLASTDRPNLPRPSRPSVVSAHGTVVKKPVIPSVAQPSSSRARKLVPGLQRHFACQHGCESRFSTAYECRRHQEDQHARPEAQGIIDAATSLPEGIAPFILPRERRFIMQIGFNGGAQWDERTKAGILETIEDEDNFMPQELALALVNFAKEWITRYNCPSCGLAFSRLDSRKRHMEKQCNA